MAGQGDEGDAMYVLQEGKVAAEIEGVGVVKEYSSTDYFGEVALVRDGNKRAASVKSVGTSTCLRLGVKPFHIVLSAGSCGEMMRAHVAVLLGETDDGAESDASSGFGDSDDEGGDGDADMMAMAALQADSTARVGYKAFLATVPLLASLAPMDLESMAQMVTAVTFKDGDVIIEQVRF